MAEIAYRRHRFPLVSIQHGVCLCLRSRFTRVGGNQYINSAAMGEWEDFLLQEMVPAIEQQRFRCGGSGHRGVSG